MPANLLEALLAQPRRWAGRGINHAGDRFRAVLQLQPLVGGKALLLDYVVTGDNGVHFHAEATLLGRDAAGALCLWPVMEELPGVLAHPQIAGEVSASGAISATFASGPRSTRDAFREEITLVLHPDGGLELCHAWGLPGGEFDDRSSCQLRPSPAT